MTLSTILKISRPRFWFYLAGPYLIGLAAAADSWGEAWSMPSLIWGLFWLLPANLLLYGVNDINDYATDRRNPKKKLYEQLVKPDQFADLKRAILIATLPFFPMLFVSGRLAVGILYLFLGLAYFYSAPPIRAKSIPFLDSVFNILYILPGLFGYVLAGGSELSPKAMVAAACWCLAMHAFSAVPDITVDRKAKIHTVGTTLGFYGTLVASMALFIISAELAKPYLGWVAVAAGDIYALSMIAAMFLGTESRVFRLYKLFPYLNILIGAAIVAVVADQSVGNGALERFWMIRL